MPSTWTTSLPSGATKIRMLPNICQDRWTNIQNGQVPSTSWLLARRAGNPGTVATSGQIFTKDGGSGSSEFYYKDDASNTTQLTKAGGVGALTQKVYANNITMKPGATEINNPQQAFCCAFGFFSSQSINGNYPPDAGSYNIASYDRTSTGHYKINLNFTATSRRTYVPLLTMRKLSSSQIWEINIVQQETTYFEVRITENGLLSDGDFCCAIFGAFT